MDVETPYKVIRTGSLWSKNPPLWHELLNHVADKSLDSYLMKYDAVFIKGSVDVKLLFGKIEFKTPAGYTEFCLQWM